jgi:hypothetical protein
MTLPISLRHLTFLSILALAPLPAHGSQLKKEVDVSPGEELDLELATGAAVEVRGWDEDRVRVEARLSGTASRFDVEKKGRRVVVRIEPESGGGGSTSHRLEIRVPHRFDVRIESAGGGLVIKDVEGTFRGETGGGSIVLEKLKGRAKLSTGGGDIDVRSSELDGKVSTGGGRVRLDNKRGDLRGWSGSEREQRHEREKRHEKRHEHEERHEHEDDDEDKECRERAHKDGPLESQRSGKADGPIEIQRAGGQVDLAEAPRGATIQTGGGRIRVGPVGGSITAQTGGGAIELGPVAGSVHATTGAGRVVVKLAPTSDEQIVKITTGFGHVKVVLHPEFDGRFELETAYTRDHGPTRIESDVRLKIEDATDWDDRQTPPRRYVRARGVLGKGRGLVQITTTNGDIEIERAGR